MSFPEARPSNSARYKPVECSKSVTTASVEYCFLMVLVVIIINEREKEREKRERERVRAQLKGISPFFTGKRSNQIKSNATLKMKNERFAYQESPASISSSSSGRGRRSSLRKGRQAPPLCKVRFAKYLSMSKYYFLCIKWRVFYFKREKKKRKNQPLFFSFPRVCSKLFSLHKKIKKRYAENTRTRVFSLSLFQIRSFFRANENKVELNARGAVESAVRVWLFFGAALVEIFHFFS